MDELGAVVNLTTSLYLSSDSQDTKIQHTTECAFSHGHNKVLLS